MAKRLVVSVTGAAARRFPARQHEVAIGSEPGSNDIVLDQVGISRRHAIIRRRLGRIYIRDLGSINGTFVNGRRITGDVRIGSGDNVRLAGTSLLVGHQRLKPNPIRNMLVLAAVCFVAGFVVIFLYQGGEIGQVARARPHPHSLSIVAGTGRRAARPQVAPPSPPPSDNTMASRASQETALAIRRVNYWRILCHMRPVTEDSQWNNGEYLHLRYLVETYLSNPNEQVSLAMHNEDPASPWYTPEGMAAGMDGDLMPPCRGCSRFNGEQAIDGWLDSIFHRPGILNPEMTKIGFAIYLHAGLEAAGLKDGYAPTAAFPSTVVFPPPFAQISPSMSAFRQVEHPDPLASCPGYQSPTGLPISVAFGHGWPGKIKIAEATISRDGQPLEACAFTDSTYINRDPVDQGAGRSILSAFGMVAMIPRMPLRPGSYTVSFSLGGLGQHQQTWRSSWSFLVINQ